MSDGRWIEFEGKKYVVPEGQIMGGKVHFRNAKTREIITSKTALLQQRTGEVFCGACSK